ncbi:thiamine pyrophosphate-dependent enzyme [Pseudodesulfovibrio thermohalotolerans]|jgi:2-oxoglutarate ferredoxin oxidoreductase subunit beta|uniref:thiamine pyrophosphate-dependent enzyme n=1 Tax=Pseudodesulfovibrio thermohalotolerans TaxID=2880651 RepID=UPI00244332B7|nr:thiamine pyrophosphate-dependent enzyme [Pseudodesulfovibrio thermohalotolerans]WFS63114.1 thiamine pyrophosphate-dependent enzyme [Pseudodesulfovibrio thermohalotolerans]
MENLSSKYGKTLNLDKLTSYCPGCGHGTVTRLVAEAIENLGIMERTVSIVGIGCGGFSHHYMDIDAIEATHGRSPSFAIGYKLARPDNIVFTYAGDGDTCAIGLGDLLHAANKGMPITTIMVNNTVFGMTGGQMSPTTLEGQVTTTTAGGRQVPHQGYPLLVPEMMRAMPGVKYLARESVATPKAVRKAKKSIQKAFECQIKGLGYAFVEIIVPCPTGLKMKVKDSYARCGNEMTDYFKPQVFKDETEQNDVA